MCMCMYVRTRVYFCWGGDDLVVLPTGEAQLVSLHFITSGQMCECACVLGQAHISLFDFKPGFILPRDLHKQL